MVRGECFVGASVGFDSDGNQARPPTPGESVATPGTSEAYPINLTGHRDPLGRDYGRWRRTTTGNGGEAFVREGFEDGS
jgi:hypothetical protein